MTDPVIKGLAKLSKDSERGDGGFRGSGLPKARSDVSVLEWAVLVSCALVAFLLALFLVGVMPF